MIICGDALVELRNLKDESVSCCITSPPYYGLRDYGTAKWEGDDPECNHIETYNLKRDSSGGLKPTSLTAAGPRGTRGQQPSTLSSTIQYRQICGKCSARRIDAQLGLEKTPEEYIGKLVEVFREVCRALRKDGTLWVVIGDSYVGQNNTDMWKGLPPKNLIGIPWMLAFALRDDGWWLRQEIIWNKPNPMPESAGDRCTRAHENIFMLSKSAKYYYDGEAIAEPFADERMGNPGGGGQYAKICPYPNAREGQQSGLAKGEWNADGSKHGRNRRSVWTITTKPYREAHFATYPPDLVEPMMLAGCPQGGVALDPFFGAGTTGLVAKKLGREFIGIELSEVYCRMAERRIYGPLISAGKYQEKGVM